MVFKVVLRFLDFVSGCCNGVGEFIFMVWVGMQIKYVSDGCYCFICYGKVQIFILYLVSLGMRWGYRSYILVL